MKNFRSIIATFVILCISAGMVNAQSRSGQPVTPMKVGSTTLNLGIGIGSTYDGYDYGNKFGTKAALEFGLWQAGPGVVTLGGEVGGSFTSGDLFDNDDYKARTIVVAARSAWHFGWNVRGLDTYAGVSAGVGFEHYDYRVGNEKRSNDKAIPVFGGFVGASYFFTPTFGVNAEAGYDITNIQAGVIFKFK